MGVFGFGFNLVYFIFTDWLSNCHNNLEVLLLTNEFFLQVAVYPSPFASSPELACHMVQPQILLFGWHYLILGGCTL